VETGAAKGVGGEDAVTYDPQRAVAVLALEARRAMDKQMEILAEMRAQLAGLREVLDFAKKMSAEPPAAREQGEGGE
jgi:hypothetical protein